MKITIMIILVMLFSVCQVNAADRYLGNYQVIKYVPGCSFTGALQFKSALDATDGQAMYKLFQEGQCFKIKDGVLKVYTNIMLKDNRMVKIMPLNSTETAYSFRHFFLSGGNRTNKVK